MTAMTLANLGQNVKKSEPNAPLEADRKGSQSFRASGRHRQCQFSYFVAVPTYTCVHPRLEGTVNQQ